MSLLSFLGKSQRDTPTTEDVVAQHHAQLDTHESQISAITDVLGGLKNLPELANILHLGEAFIKAREFAGKLDQIFNQMEEMKEQMKGLSQLATRIQGVETIVNTFEGKLAELTNMMNAELPRLHELDSIKSQLSEALADNKTLQANLATRQEPDTSELEAKVQDLEEQLKHANDQLDIMLGAAHKVAASKQAA